MQGEPWSWWMVGFHVGGKFNNSLRTNFLAAFWTHVAGVDRNWPI